MRSSASRQRRDIPCWSLAPVRNWSGAVREPAHAFATLRRGPFDYVVTSSRANPSASRGPISSRDGTGVDRPG